MCLVIIWIQIRFIPGNIWNYQTQKILKNMFWKAWLPISSMCSSPGIQKQVSLEDRLKINIEIGSVHNQTTGETIEIQPLSGYVLDILRMGGIKPLVKANLQ